MDNFMIAVILFIAIIFLSRIINERATKKLSQEKKAELIDLFSKSRIYSMGILIAIIIFYFASLKLQIVDPNVAVGVYFVLILTFLVITGYQSFNKLKGNNFPDSYIKSHLLSTTIKLLGFVLFVTLIAFNKGH
jgi:hypothetical protein